MFLNQVMMHKDEKKLPVTSIFSFGPFMDFLEKRVKQEDINTPFLQKIVSVFKASFPDGNYVVSADDTAQYEHLYKLIYQIMTNPLKDENKICWGLSNTFSSVVAYGTNALQEMLSWKTQKEFVSIVNFKSNCTLSETEVKQVMMYSFLIKRLYNISIFNTTNLIFNIPEDEMDKYYQVDFNDQFVTVDFQGELPQIDKTITEMENMSKESTLEWLQKAIPLEKVSFTGFSIVEVIDVTERVLREHLRDLLLTRNLDEDTQMEISKIVRKLAGRSDLDLLLLPIFYLNNRVITEIWQTNMPNIQSLLNNYQIDLKEFTWALNKYASNPRLIFRENIQENKGKNEDLTVLLNSKNLEGLILKPVFNKKKLIGVLLIVSQHANVISDQILYKIEDALPLIENLFETTIGNYRSILDKVIKSRFTSIQQSVEWKFNEVALQYIKDRVTDNHPTLLPIRFENVYPIYGAIDFRNSTIERNQAEVDDWILQLHELSEVIKKIKNIVQIDFLGEWIFRTNQWISSLEENVDTNKEYAINHFLEKESMELLDQLMEMDHRIKDIVEPYKSAMQSKGVFHKNSLALEKTFKILNSNIASILDQMNEKLQETYPCYFERYRTDGIEFNIYIGQSMTPNKPFNTIFLKNVQLWQLNTMALIAKITEQSQELLPRKIHTTQLIFVHSNTITTSFRLDERRFDVEGGYNIRYEIIKKRIDKALISGTGERLTQPGKIAIVYFQKKDIEDYLIHIHYLQEMNILTKELEFLDLEDMQGVSGLKALRVGVSDAPFLENGKERFLLNNPISKEQMVAHTA